jgi:hypothetical protein
MRQLFTPAFILVLGLLALAEVGAHLFFAQSVSGRFEYGYSPTAGFRENGNGVVELYRAGGRPFHPQSFMKERPPGTFRIFVVGDSVPRGPSFKDAYPWVLGRELRKRQVPAESFNLALPGYGARRCQVVFKKVLEYEPSLIILHIDDTNKYEDEREYRRSQEFKGWHPRHWLMKIFIFRRLYEAKLEKVFWKLVPQQIREKFALRDPDAPLRAMSKDPRERAEMRQLALEVTAQDIALARRRNVPVLLISQCRLEPSPGNPCSLTDRDLDSLGRSLIGKGVYHLSMKEVFSRVPDPQDYFADGSHMKKSGHRLLAEAIMQKVQGERLLEIAASKGGGEEKGLRARAQ